MALKILDKALAEQLYRKILKLIKQPKRQYYDKFIDIGVILERIYTEITKGEKAKKDDLYEKIIYVKNKYRVDSEIISRSHDIRKTINDRRHEGEIPKPSKYPIFIEILMDCIEYYSSVSKPSELQTAYENLFYISESKVKNTKPRTAIKPKTVAKPKAAAKSTPVAKSKTVAKPKTPAKPKTVTKARPAAKPTPVAKSKTAAKQKKQDLPSKEMDEIIKMRTDDLILNPTPRCACVLVLDTSGSMEGQRIKELNKGVKQFIKEVKEDELAPYSVEIGIITVGPDVKQKMQITPVHKIKPVSSFRASGGTPLGEAVTAALDMLETRKGEYKTEGVPYYQPWLVLMSDGEPTDSWQDAASKSRSIAKKKKLVVMPVGVSNANLAVLSLFSNRPAKALAGLKFKEFFAWLSASMARVAASGSTTSKIELPPTRGWDSI